MIVLLTILFIVFLFFNYIFFITLKKEEYTKSENYLKFSILISFKNEGKNLEGLIDNLFQLDYPEDLYEVILIDDLSNDNSYQIVESKVRGLSNYFLLNNENNLIAGKKGALTKGLNFAKNDFIAITDADCIIPSNWLRGISNIFNNGNDIFFGLAPFIQEPYMINEITCFENLRNSILTFLSAKKGYPFSGAARNMAYNKNKILEIGGYSNTLETISGDDDLLIREAIKHNLKICFNINEDNAVYTYSKKNLKDYLNQRGRHTKTSLYYSKKNQLFLAMWHFMNIILLFSYFMPLKILVDIIIVKALEERFCYKFSNYKIIYNQILYEIFRIIHFVNAITRKEKW